MLIFTHSLTFCHIYIASFAFLFWGVYVCVHIKHATVSVRVLWGSKNNFEGLVLLSGMELRLSVLTASILTLPWFFYGIAGRLGPRASCASQFAFLPSSVWIWAHAHFCYFVSCQHHVFYSGEFGSLVCFHFCVCVGSCVCVCVFMCKYSYVHVNVKARGQRQVIPQELFIVFLR